MILGSMEKHTKDEAKRKLEDRHCVQISDAAFGMAVQGLRTYDSKPIIFDDASAMEILDGACKLVFERFRNCAYETSFYEKAHQLRWDLVELIELYSSHGPQINPSLWVTRLRWERDCESVFMNDYFRTWKYVVESSGGSCILTREHLQKLSLFKDHICNKKKYCLDDVVWFINGIRDNLVTSFGPLLTVTCSHVAEVVSNLSDVPLTLLLPSTIDSKKLKAMHMTNLRVLEQKLEIYDIYDTLARPSVCSSSSTRPRASFLLLGQSGAGKTEIAKAVAEHWYCDASRLVKIHMPDYDADESALWGRLAEVVAERPYSVIVLDKIDKVSPSARRALVDALSKEAGDVDLSNSIIFMTSGVGSDELSLVCQCHHRDEETHKLFLQNPPKFLNTHDCTLKGSGRERALIEARKFFGADVLDSVDKVLAVKRFVDYRAVCRVLLREVVREIYGQRLVVLASNVALLFLVNMNIRTQIYKEGGKALKKLLMEKVIRGLPDAGQDLKNVVVYVDKLVGTTQVSFSIHRHEQSADDWYFKLKDGTFDKLMANLRTKVESVCRIFKLRSEYLSDCNDDDDGLTRELLAEKIFDEILMWSPFQEMPSDIYRDITESSVPSSWERKQFKDCPMYVEELKRRARSLVAAGKKEQQLRVVAAKGS